jgi:pSer/pThr/pTyr-binding forkhead associated (FHA) protein
MSVRPLSGGIKNVPQLLPVHGPGDRRPRPLDRDVATIGRARGCDLCLEASDVSTVHCMIFRATGGYQLRDCNSRTGTRINGEQVRGSRLVRDGDILQIGPFSFELQLPRLSVGIEPAAASPVVLQRVQGSRRRLAGHALRLRKRLRDAARDMEGRRRELEKEFAQVEEKTRAYDRRLEELNEADRELETDREALRAHIQQAEGELARRREESEQQVHAQWQEFQRRCQAEEARLRAELESVTEGRAQQAACSEAVAAATAHALAAREEQLAQQLERLRLDRQEFEGMKQQFENGQVDAHAELDVQRAAVAQQETMLRGQRAELVRMLDELKKLQEELRRPMAEQVNALARENDELRRSLAAAEKRVTTPTGGSARELKEMRAENELLRMLLQDRERALNEATEQMGQAQPAAPAESADVDCLRSENEVLKQLLAEKDVLVEELRIKAAPKPPKSATELERYEAELTQDRQQLERERSRLETELEHLRVRNQELDEATREMEMEMSRERAELARERQRMERMREELKVDMEKLQREMSVRESLGAVHRLRDEINKKSGAKSPDAADRLRHLHAGQDTPRA